MRDLHNKLNNSIWTARATTLPWWKRMPLNFVRIFYLVIADLSNGQLNLRAMSLVFTTILSLVPLIAVSFSVLKAFGVHNEIEPFLINLFAPLGSHSVVLTENIIGFVDNVKVGLLGTIGIAFLFYSVLSLLQKVEEAFNYTWRVERGRSLVERFSTYLSVIMVGPVLVFAALGITASFLNHAVVQSVASIGPLSASIALASKLMPYVLVVTAFTFIYLFIPNTKVKFLPALTGGIVAGVMWQSAGWLYALFVAESTSQAAIYAGFAIVFFFMMWLYLSWLILLVGSSVAFYQQHPEHLLAKSRIQTVGLRERESLALSLLQDIAAAYYDKRSPLTVDDLAEDIDYPKAVVEDVLESLEQGNLIKQVEPTRVSYLPAVPLEELKLSEVLDVVRGRSGSAQIESTRDRHLIVEEVMQRVDAVRNSVLDEYTVKDLLSDATEEIPEISRNKSKNVTKVELV